MKKTFIRIIALAVVSSLLVFSFCSCDSRTDEEKIFDRITEFAECYNAGDLDGVTACLDKKTKNVVETSLKLVDSFMGGIMGELMGGFMDDISLSDLFGLTGLLGDEIMKFSDVSIEMESPKSAIVTCTMDMSVMDESVSEFVEFKAVKEGNDWFISIDIPDLF